MKKSPKWSYRKALAVLIGSTILTFTCSLSGYGIWKSIRKKRLTHPQYRIVAIVQTGPEKEALKTAYLAELLHLRSDQPQSLYAFNLREAEKKLLASPLISLAKIRRIEPGTLYIDYTVRKPIAKLADYENIGLDEEGYLFPLSPFLSPKNLPEMYLGLPPFGVKENTREGGEWNRPLQDRYFFLALQIHKALDEAPWREGMRIKRIDVSNAFAESYGQREIVLLTEDEWLSNDTLCLFPKILRLPTKDPFHQLSNFLSLKRAMLEDYKKQIANMQFEESIVYFEPRIIDLRLPKLAFVQNQS